MRHHRTLMAGGRHGCWRTPTTRGATGRDLPHLDTEVVDVADPRGGTDRVPVARLCTTCLERLPFAWGCEDCDWIEEPRFCSATPDLVLGRPCPVHQHDYLTGA